MTAFDPAAPLRPWIHVADGVVRFARLDRARPAHDFDLVVALADLEALDLADATCTVRTGGTSSQHTAVEWKRRAREAFGA